jgi:diguanylate cyclase (GGDEF)-like protein/PAS domain S-box-containing protein
MKSWLWQQLRTTDVSTKPDRALRARAFGILIPVMSLLLAVGVIHSFLTGRPYLGVALLFGVTAVAVLNSLARRGAPGLASAMLAPIFLLLLVAVLLLGSGTHSVALAATGNVLLIGCMLLGRRAFAAFTAVMVLAFVAIAYGEMGGVVQNSFSGFTTYGTGIVLTAIVIASAVFTRVVVEELRDRLKEAQVKTAALAENYAELESRAAALEASDARFRRIFHSSPQPTTINRYSDGTFLEVNDAWTRTFGYSRDEVLGRRPQDIPTWANPADRKTMFMMLAEKGSLHDAEFQIRKKSGEIADILLSVEEIDFGGERAVIAPIRDITEQKRSARLLRLSEERFAKIIQATPQSMSVNTVDDGTFLEVNQACADLYGFSREEMIGRNAIELGLWPNPESRAELIRELLSHGTIKARETALRTKSGELRELLLSATLVELDEGERVLLSAVDVTEPKLAKKLLRQSEERFAKIFQSNPDAIVISTMAEGRYIEVNQAWLDVFGYSREQLIGHTSFELGIWVNTDERARMLRQLAESKSLRNFATRLRKRSGEVADVLLAAELIDLGGAQCIIFMLHDITQRKRAEERIQHLATRDYLTGLPNRLLLADRLALSINIAQRNGSRLALLFIDMDRFKTINDSLGHQIGDAFLKAVAERLSGIMRAGDTLARSGGDEFVVLLENFDSVEDVAQAALKMLGELAKPFTVEGHLLSATCSIGISLFPGDGGNPLTLMREADTAMYHAKEKGRGTYQFYSAEMNSHVRERLRQETSLRAALGNKEFRLEYQPKVDIASGRMTGMEALLRWRHADLGDVPPQQFISVAEDLGLIVDIGHWVLEQACRQIGLWRASGYPALRVAVNLSVRQFNDKLVPDIISLLRDSGTDPTQIELEITESLFMRDPAEIAAILGQLNALGMHVTLDDFGTGYSSLIHIKRFFVDALKIDRSFVTDIATNAQTAAIVKAVVAMARGLDIRVIAEGVEQANQLRLLKTLGCDEYQGFLFSRAIAPDELERRYLAA